jgi:hypothetical protein
VRDVVERAMICRKTQARDCPAEVIGAFDDAQVAGDVEKEHIKTVLESSGWRIRGTNGAAVVALRPTRSRPAWPLGRGRNRRS